MHNTVIVSIKKNGKELIPYDNPNYTFAYDDPRGFPPTEYPAIRQGAGAVLAGFIHRMSRPD